MFELTPEQFALIWGWGWVIIMGVMAGTLWAGIAAVVEAYKQIKDEE